jgi:hypothetical protein
MGLRFFLGTLVLSSWRAFSSFPSQSFRKIREKNLARVVDKPTGFAFVSLFFTGSCWLHIANEWENDSPKPSIAPNGIALE